MATTNETQQDNSPNDPVTGNLEQLKTLLPKLVERMDQVRRKLNTPFDLDVLVNRFTAQHPQMDLSRCNIYVGDQHTEAQEQAVAAGMEFRGIPISFIPGAVGVVVMPPDYAREQASVGTKTKKKVTPAVTASEVFIEPEWSKAASKAAGIEGSKAEDAPLCEKVENLPSLKEAGKPSELGEWLAEESAAWEAKDAREKSRLIKQENQSEK